MPMPRNYVPGPNFTPLPFGLLTSTLDVRTPGDVHWQNGISYETLCAEGARTYDECLVVTGAANAPPPPPPSKTPTASMARRGATPFTVYTEVDCSAPGFWERSTEMVGNSLTQSEQWQVEYAFWTGLAAGQTVVFPHLAANATLFDDVGFQLQTAATTVSGSAVFDLVEGVGLLEAAMADCYDGVPVLHVPRALLPAFALNMLLIREGPAYRTPGGSRVVFGAGYRGTGPDGSAGPASDWIYATGALMIYRSAATVMPDRSTLDRAENTVRAIAERTYVLAWDCCHYAVNISTGGVSGGVSQGAG